MRLELPYGESTTEVDVDDDRILQVVDPVPFKKKELGALLSDSIANPVGKPLSEFLEGKKTVCLVLNDLTRPTPTASILEALLPHLAGVDLSFIIATGTHKPPAKPELRKIMGRFYEEYSSSVYAHESRDEESLRYAGETSRGTSVYFNKVVWEVDGLLNINSVEPHYFAGFTGGRKSFLPGLSSYKTVTKNHSLALEEGSQLCRLDGNPVNEDMEEASTLIEKEIYSLNVVLDTDSDVVGAFCGPLRESFRAAAKYCTKKYTFALKEKADVVLAAVKPPMCNDLYQTQKVIEPAKMALKEGGVLVFVAPCKDGVGPENYYALMSSSKDVNTILMSIKQEYKLGYHKAARLLDITTWADMYGVTDLDDKVLERVFMKPYGSAQEAVDAALEKAGSDGKLIYMSNALLTIPK